MSSYDAPQRGLGIVRPGRAVIGAMVALGAIWLMFAIAVNWAGASMDVFLLFCGNTERILHGEVWRLFTAPFMHLPSGTTSHILFAILGLFFLAPSLEQQWGAPRMLRFLFFSGVIAYAFQMLLELALPASLAHRLVGNYWFGSFPVLESVAIAWALSFKGQQVRLWLLVPVTSTGMILFIAAMSVLRVVALADEPEGLLAPFGGMLAGWLLGGGTPSPLRRAYLRLRLAQLDHEATRKSRTVAQRKKESSLKVIEGGRGKATDRDDSGPNGRMLH